MLFVVDCTVGGRRLLWRERMFTLALVVERMEAGERHTHGEHFFISDSCCVFFNSSFLPQIRAILKTTHAQLYKTTEVCGST